MLPFSGVHHRIPPLGLVQVVAANAAVGTASAAVGAAAGASAAVGAAAGATAAVSGAASVAAPVAESWELVGVEGRQAVAGPGAACILPLESAESVEAGAGKPASSAWSIASFLHPARKLVGLCLPNSFVVHLHVLG